MFSVIRGAMDQLATPSLALGPSRLPSDAEHCRFRQQWLNLPCATTPRVAPTNRSP